MSATSSIEWTEATWNPVSGCTEVSAGCDRCYAKTFAERFRGTPGHYFERGFDVQLRPNMLELPLKWRKPKRIFVNSMSDLFHDQVPDEYIAQVFGVMADAKQHTFQLLTKRHARMRSLLSTEEFKQCVYHHSRRSVLSWWPLPNVWLGVSTENQQWADIRIPALLDTPAAVRFISAEPLLGPIDLRQSLAKWIPSDDHPAWKPTRWGREMLAHDVLHWVIVGGESGHGARPMHPDWARSLRDQCRQADVAFLFKQFGEYAPSQRSIRGYSDARDIYVQRDGTFDLLANSSTETDRSGVMRRVGKKAAGRELDGRTWDQFPEVSNA